jgi:D-ribose pyranose/furanose isomerase RbsD
LSTVTAPASVTVIRIDLPVPKFVDDVDLSARLDHIRQLTDALAKVRDDAIEQQVLSEKIHREIQAAKATLKPVR